MADKKLKIVEVAESQVGYLEKATNADLDDFKANPGRGNYTKYGAWYGMNGVEWCDEFVSWCAYESDEQEAIGKFAYVPFHWAFFESRGETRNLSYVPEPGDLVFFRELEHIGIVTDCKNGIVYTVEGNTSGADYESEGNGVWAKSYSLSSNYLYGYAHPNYKNKSRTKNYLKSITAQNRGRAYGFIYRNRVFRY